MGRLYDLIQAHIDAQPYEVSERQVAHKIGVTQTTLANWREPKRLIAKHHLKSISRVTGVPYLRVLDALLEDIGYLREEDTSDGAPMNPTTPLSAARSSVTADDLAGLPNVARKKPQKTRLDD